MTILEQILAGLQQKFTGVDTAILTRIATKKAEGVTDETKVNSIVEGISFSDVLNSYGDFRAGDASKTAVSNYEKKHNLKDGKSDIYNHSLFISLSSVAIGVNSVPLAPTTIYHHWLRLRAFAEIYLYIVPICQRTNQ